MANNYRYGGHRRFPVTSASGAITSGALCAQEGIFGVALTSVASGTGLYLGVEGVWVLDVPASTVKGDILYGPDPDTDAVAVTLSRVSNTPAGHTFPMGRAMSARDADGKGLVWLAAQLSAQ